MADDTMNYLECQKRAVCEIWRWTKIIIWHHDHVLMINNNDFQTWEQFPACWQDGSVFQGKLSNAGLNRINRIQWQCSKPVIFQYAEMLNLPDGVLDIVDEFSDAREEGLENEISCEQLHDSCPSETILQIRSKIQNLLQWVRLWFCNINIVFIIYISDRSAILWWKD